MPRRRARLDRSTGPGSPERRRDRRAPARPRSGRPPPLRRSRVEHVRTLPGGYLEPEPGAGPPALYAGVAPRLWPRGLHAGRAAAPRPPRGPRGLPERSAGPLVRPRAAGRHDRAVQATALRLPAGLGDAGAAAVRRALHQGPGWALRPSGGSALACPRGRATARFDGDAPAEGDRGSLGRALVRPGGGARAPPSGRDAALPGAPVGPGSDPRPGARRTRPATRPGSWQAGRSGIAPFGRPGPPSRPPEGGSPRQLEAGASSRTAPRKKTRSATASMR